MTDRKLAVFPAFHRVAGRRVVVVGGGHEAATKIRLLAETKAEIVVYAALPGAAGPMAMLAETVAPVVRGAGVQRLLKRVVGRLPGPTPAARAKSGAQVWGQVTDADGKRVTGTMSTPNPYDLTADAVVTIAQRILAGEVPPGTHTPSTALGPDFARGLVGVKVDIA